MSNPVSVPDPQHVMLDALNDAIDEAVARCHDDGHSRDDIDACFPAFNEETGRAGYESVVFDGDPYEAGYDDPEEYREIVMMVGARDLDIKITEARTTLNNLNELLCPRHPEEFENG